MPLHPVSDPPPGFYVSLVHLPEGRRFVAGHMVFGDDGLVAMIPFTMTVQSGNDGYIRLYRRRDEAIRACEAASQMGKE